MRNVRDDIKIHAKDLIPGIGLYTFSSRIESARKMVKNEEELLGKLEFNELILSVYHSMGIIGSAAAGVYAIAEYVLK